VYLNFLGDDGDDRAAAAYGSSLTRLSELKRRYDPQNVFRANQNIIRLRLIHSLLRANDASFLVSHPTVAST
jgi:hypothetical protein